MRRLRYAPGEAVFSEGEPSAEVFRIASGTAEVLKEVDGRAVTLGTVRAGEFVGEMGVIEGRARGATVRATSELVLEPLGREDFLRRISEDRDAAFQVILRLSERLRRTNERLVGMEEAPDSGATASAEPRGDAVERREAAPRVTIFGASEIVAAYLPDEGLTVEEFPFTVGRRPVGREAWPVEGISLPLDDFLPYRLSRMHFAILRSSDGRYEVRDVGSKLGTEVNGGFLGEDFPRVLAILRHGENRIVAGGGGSPFAFRIVVG
jgi:CRP/FNR family transcriptional regulator, cyclic AMP receptor protein